ncbi:uncharacterized protein LOC129947105 [Eupeodes corollae]|uniref:uncharacterized protein LOC129947105 n=1 Tax=Eupeodes corollae TaxID=290404 RepID=UPI00249319DA|nr:uncharacterized protein LOC129947105 [Eupeodes corollae]
MLKLNQFNCLPTSRSIILTIIYLSFCNRVVSLLIDSNTNVTSTFNISLLGNHAADAENNSFNKSLLRIYGEGIESKFPPILEMFVQRIQSFFSVYQQPLLLINTSNFNQIPTTTVTVSTTTSKYEVISEKSNTSTTNADLIEDQDYNELISIGEDSEFISVGESGELETDVFIGATTTSTNTEATENKT